jgi:hypothetical protein
MRRKISSENLKERHHSEYLCVDGKIMLLLGNRAGSVYWVQVAEDRD